MRRRIFLWASFLALGAVAASATEGPEVRVEAEQTRLVVGQATLLRVTVLAPGWFPAPPEFPSLEVPNAAIRLPPDSSYPTNERRGRATWSGIVRDYTFQALQPGRYRLEGQRVRVTYMDPDVSERRSVDVAIPAIEFEAFVPAGAEGLDPFLSGRSLVIEQSFEGDEETLEAGGAMKRTLTARVEGMAGMFLPPLIAAEDLSGMRVYPGAPSVRDEEGTGIREESGTYVFERGGRFRIPEVALSYWNTESRAVEVVTAPALEVSVRSASLATSGEPLRPSSLVFGATLLTLVASAAWFLRAVPARCLDVARRALRRVETSEALAWRRMSRAIRSDDARAALRRLLAWEAHPSLSPAMTPIGVPIVALREAAYGGTTSAAGAWNTAARTALLSALKTRRKQRRTGTKSRKHTALPTLNPVPNTPRTPGSDSLQ